MPALALELSIRSRPTGGGGIAAPGLTSNGFTLKASTNTLKIADTTTPANNYEGVPEAKIVTTRATTAWYWNSSGVMTSAAVSTLRLDYDPRLGSDSPGYLIEEQRTNQCKWSNDLTNAAWVATNVTAAKNQTGPDGAANSASSITATAANGTILQTIVIGSQARSQSAFVKRLTGSGVIEMTTDNITWVPITVTASWARVEIPVQTLANPICGIRIATSGDAIAVWCMQSENGIIAVANGSSPMPTTTVNVTRNHDIPKLSGTLFPLSQLEGTLYAKAMVEADQTAGTAAIVMIDDGAVINESVSLDRAVVAKKLQATVRDNNVAVALFNGNNVVNIFTTFKASCGFKLNDTAAAFSGEAMPATDTVCIMPTTTSITFGNRPAGGSASLMGWLLEVMYLPTRVTNEQLAALVA